MVQFTHKWIDFLSDAFRSSGAHGSRRLLRDLIQSNSNSLHPSEILAWIKFGSRFSSYWWEPHCSKHATLRRSNPADADFYRSAFSNKSFSALYNRQQPWHGDLSKALTKSSLAHFEEVGSINWTVLNNSSEPIGLASLSGFSKENSRAEVSLGFPESMSARETMAASMLILRFAFSVAKLNKLTSYVYEDNAHARDFTRNFGFQQEGFLEDHFWLPPHGFVGVNVFGLTRTRVQQHERLQNISTRVGVGAPLNPKLDPMLWINAE